MWLRRLFFPKHGPNGVNADKIVKWITSEIPVWNCQGLFVEKAQNLNLFFTIKNCNIVQHSFLRKIKKFSVPEVTEAWFGGGIFFLEILDW